MPPTIYKVTEIESGILSVMAKPVSGEWIDDEFFGLKRLGIDKIVSLLEKFEETEVGLSAEKDLCLKHGMEFSSFPIQDLGLPNTKLADPFLSDLLAEIRTGKHIAIHCRAGIGRAGIIAGGVLVKSGITAKEAFALISSARGVQVPETKAQAAWLCAL